MRVQDVMMRTPAVCGPETNLGAAIEIMWNRNCGLLPIINAAQKVIGVVTDRDLCVALGTRNRLPGEITVGQVTGSVIYSCGAGDDIHTALETMGREKVRRLVVLNAQGGVEGILSMDDVVLHALPAMAGGRTELSQSEVVETLRKVYGPQLPQVVRQLAA